MSQKPEYFGKYILLEKLAAGGMAEVFLSRAPGAGGIAKFVAIKRILPQFSDNKEFIDMFKDEAKIAINLSHSNIVGIYEFGVEVGQFFLVMDYVKGRNIRQILNKMKQGNINFNIDQIVYMCKEIAAGLDHAHRCIDGTTGKPLNITHRDMSPQNVMVSFEGEIKIIDFGIAKAETQMETTRAGTLKGKFGYMSPEQAEGHSVDLRTDNFSLGIVLWELLANDRLFIANNEINTLRKIRDCQIPSLTKINPEIHPELERIVFKALTKDRNLRYQTAAAFHRDLSRFLNRHYPDFSSQDFSMFVKSLYADEILDLNNKLVEYSQVPFKAGGQSFTNDEMVDKTLVMHEDNTVTETSPSSVQPGKLNLSFGRKLPEPSNSMDEPAPEPITLSNVNRENLLTEEDLERDTSNAESQYQEGPKGLLPDNPSNSLSLGQNVNDIPMPPTMGRNESKSYTKSIHSTARTPSHVANSKTSPSSPYVLNQANNVKAPSPFKKIISFFIYIIIAAFSYLFLTTVLPKQMHPLMEFVSNNLEKMGACSGLNNNGSLTILEDFGFNRRALCPAPQNVANNKGGDKKEDDITETEDLSSNEPVSININSEPSGAEIYINGEYRSRSTPSLLSFVPGNTVTLELRKKDYKTFITEHFDPKYLKSRTFKARLEKIEYGFISIDVKPPQFPDVYINGEKLDKPLPIDLYPIPAMEETEIVIRNPISRLTEKRKVFLNVGEKKSLVIYLQRQPAGSR